MRCGMHHTAARMILQAQHTAQQQNTTTQRGTRDTSPSTMGMKKITVNHISDEFDNTSIRIVYARCKV